MAESEQFVLRWDIFQSNLIEGFQSLYSAKDLVDVTLVAEDVLIQTHKVVLSVYSSYFRRIFKAHPTIHPVVILKDISPAALEAVIQFMYNGEVTIRRGELNPFLQTARALDIKGLMGGEGVTEQTGEERLRTQNTSSALELQQTATALPSAEIFPLQLTKVEMTASSEQDLDQLGPEEMIIGDPLPGTSGQSASSPANATTELRKPQVEVDPLQQPSRVAASALSPTRASWRLPVTRLSSPMDSKERVRLLAPEMFYVQGDEENEADQADQEDEESDEEEEYDEYEESLHDASEDESADEQVEPAQPDESAPGTSTATPAAAPPPGAIAPAAKLSLNVLRSRGSQKQHGGAAGKRDWSPLSTRSGRKRTVRAWSPISTRSSSKRRGSRASVPEIMPCTMCNKSFLQGRSLTMHMTMVHRITARPKRKTQSNMAARIAPFIKGVSLKTSLLGVQKKGGGPGQKKLAGVQRKLAARQKNSATGQKTPSWREKQVTAGRKKTTLEQRDMTSSPSQGKLLVQPDRGSLGSSSNVPKPSSGRVFACSICDLLFSGIIELRRHNQDLHANDTGPLTCPRCGGKYKDRHSLRSHLYHSHKDRLQT